MRNKKWTVTYRPTAVGNDWTYDKSEIVSAPDSESAARVLLDERPWFDLRVVEVTRYYLRREV